MNDLLPLLCSPASGRNTTANRLNEAQLVVTAENRTPYRDYDGNRYPPLTIADMEVVPTTSARLRRKDRRAARAADKAAWHAEVEAILGGAEDRDASVYDMSAAEWLAEVNYEADWADWAGRSDAAEPVDLVDADEDLLAEHGVSSYGELLNVVINGEATTQDVYGTTFDPDEVSWGFTVSDRPVGSHGGTPRNSGARDEAGRWLAAHDLAAA